MTGNGVNWSCPVCGASCHRPAFRSDTVVGEAVGGERFRPASADFGATAGLVVRCTACGHGSLLDAPGPAAIERAYQEVTDVDSLREEAGQVATARRDLAVVARLAGTARGRLLDVGCWTGSLLVAAGELGWQAEGVEPSTWAVERARERGLRATRGALGEANDSPGMGTYSVVVCCDVIEHLLDPRQGVQQIAEQLEPGGLLFATVPDAGSLLARVLGRRWWSVLPMHVQYFTRASLTMLLVSSGFVVESVSTHPKVFSRRYYGDRIREFIPVVGDWVARAVDGSRNADRLVAPDFHDRIAIVARRNAPS